MQLLAQAFVGLAAAALQKTPVIILYLFLVTPVE
jgi:hypothetical protein